MENNTALENNPAAYQKARLIHETIETLRAAHRIDERDDLDEASFRDWYDRTIPEVREIKILAGAMEVELARRRGERIIAEGERRGRPEKVVHPTTFLSQSGKDQRSRDRRIASQPAAVKAYVQGQAKAGRVPSVGGAVRAAHLAMPKRKAKIFQGQQQRLEQFDMDIITTIDELADGVRRSDAQISKITGRADPAREFVPRVRLIPWLTIDRTVEGTIFRINEPLRAICEGHRSYPELEFKSISDYLHELRTELTRRRKKNNDERIDRMKQVRWNHTAIDRRQQTDLLDWIEDQLDRVPTL
jgi:hypothetical protein